MAALGVFEEPLWESPELATWAHKQGEVLKTWRPRFLVLKSGRIYWLLHAELLPARTPARRSATVQRLTAATPVAPQGTQPRGCVSVHRYAALRTFADGAARPHVVELVPRHSAGAASAPPLRLAFATDADARRWVDALAHLVGAFEAELALATQLVALEGGVVSAPLFACGRRCLPSKVSFLCRDAAGRDAVATLMADASLQPLDAADAAAERARGDLRWLLCSGLRHPFLWPAVAVAFHAAQRRLCVLRPLAGGGSLRDALRGGDAQGEYVDKYSSPGRPLPLHELRRMGRQVLEALAYLQARGLAGVHVHAGNVLLDGGDAFLSGEVVDLELLGAPVPPELATRHPAATALGRLLYEMATGAPPPRSGPNFGAVRDAALQALLRALLEPAADAEPPGAAAVARNPLFASVALAVDVRYANAPLLEPHHLAYLRAAGAAPVVVEAPNQCSRLPGQPPLPLPRAPAAPRGREEDQQQRQQQRQQERLEREARREQRARVRAERQQRAAAAAQTAEPGAPSAVAGSRSRSGDSEGTASSSAPSPTPGAAAGEEGREEEAAAGGGWRPRAPRSGDSPTSRIGAEFMAALARRGTEPVGS